MKVFFGIESFAACMAVVVNGVVGLMRWEVQPFSTVWSTFIVASVILWVLVGMQIVREN